MKARGAWMLAVAALELALTAPACSKSDSGAPHASAASAAVDAGQPVDLETMAFLSEARALHHQANVREQENDVHGAAKAVQSIVQAKRPHAGERVPEIEEVLADAYARIAELDLRAGDVEGAAHATKDGLTHAPEASYFRGHLLEVQGIAEETRAATLGDAGDAKGAAAARAAATRLLEEAVGVQERVIEEALGDAGPSGEGGTR